MSIADLQVTTAQLGDHTTIVSLSGELDVSCARDLEAKLWKATQIPTRRVIVDMADVAFVDSSGLAVLAGAARAARRAGGEFVVVCSDPWVVRIFRSTGLDRLFRLERTLADAVGRLRATLADDTGPDSARAAAPR